MNGVSFDVKSGEFLVVIGLSGSGKTTLMRCLNRLLDPSSGKILFRDQRVDLLQGQDVRLLRRDIGMIFQNFNLVPKQLDGRKQCADGSTGTYTDGKEV